MKCIRLQGVWGILLNEEVRFWGIKVLKGQKSNYEMWPKKRHL